MAKPFKTYFCRLPQAFVDLIKFETARVGAGYSTSRALVSKMLEDFLVAAPWKKTSWKFPGVPDVRKYGGDKTGSVQYNVFVTPDLGARLDTAIQENGVSKASFFLGAIAWWLSRNLTDGKAKKLFADTAKSMGFRYRDESEEELSQNEGDASQEQSTPLPMRVSNLEPLASLSELKKNKELPEYDDLFMPSIRSDVLAAVQGKATSGLVTWEQVNSAIDRLKPITDEYGKDADGSSFWFVGQEGDSSAASFRKRATMVVLRVRDGVWRIARCYRTNIRANASQTGNLALAPLVHAWRGEKALEAYVAGEAQLMFRTPGDYLRKQCASESLTNWLGFLIRAVAKEVMTPDEATTIAAWRLSKSDTEEGEVVTFAKTCFPLINRDITDEVMRLLADGCEDEALLIKAMARSTDRISDPEYRWA